MTKIFLNIFKVVISLAFMSIITVLLCSCGGGGGNTESGTGQNNENISAPISPSLLSYEYSLLTVTLNWVDNSDNESEFVIEKAIDGSEFVELASIGENITQFSDVSIANSNQNLSYRVKAINGSGDSDYSNQIDITISAVTSCPQITIENTCLNAGVFSLQCEWDQNVCDDYQESYDFTPDEVNTGDRIWPDEHGEAHITTWKDDKLAAFSFTIDDNWAPNHEWWKEQGENYDFQFTWFVIAERISGDNSSFNGIWEDYQELFDLGHDIQSHTLSHNHGEYTIEEEYERSQELINNNIVGVDAITMAYPGGLKTDDSEIDDKQIAAEYYISARGVAGQINKVDEIDYMNTNVIGSASLDPANRVGTPNLIEYNSTYPQSRTYRGWQVQLFHGLNEDEEAEALSLMEYLEEHRDDFWVGLYREVALYGLERDTAKLDILNVSETSISLRLRDQKDNDIFNYPLTIKLRIDNDWDSYSVTQNGEEIDASEIIHNENKYVLIQATPDGGDIILMKK